RRQVDTLKEGCRTDKEFYRTALESLFDGLAQQCRHLPIVKGDAISDHVRETVLGMNMLSNESSELCKFYRVVFFQTQSQASREFLSISRPSGIDKVRSIRPKLKCDRG